MGFIITIHQRFGRVGVPIYILIVGLYALFHLMRRKPLEGDFWGMVVIGEGLILVQAIVGMVMFITGISPGRDMHFLYGALIPLLWPAAFGYTRNQSQQRETLIWGLISLFMFGLALRAMSTGVIVPIT